MQSVQPQSVGPLALFPVLQAPCTALPASSGIPLAWRGTPVVAGPRPSARPFCGRHARATRDERVRLRRSAAPEAQQAASTPEQEVLGQLRRIVDPDFGTDIVSCGFVKDLKVNGVEWAPHG